MKSRRKGTKKNKKTRRKRGGMETTTPPTRRNSPVTSPFIPPIALPPPAIQQLPTITTLNARFQEDSMEDTYQDSMRRAINSGENYAPRILQILQRHLDDYQWKTTGWKFYSRSDFEILLTNDVNNFRNYTNNQNQRWW